MSPADGSTPDAAADIEGVDDLYGLDPDEFVPARTALAKQLRSDGRRDAAKAVTALRKPTKAAWAINVAVRRAPDLRAAVLDAGERMREAFAGGLAGGAEELRATRDAEREAVDALVDAAAEALEDEGGASPAAVDAIRTTIHGTASDEELRDGLARGRLARTGSGVGLGLGDGGSDTPAPSKHPKRAATSGGKRSGTKTKKSRKSKKSKKSKKASDDERKATAEAEQALATAEQAIERARREREARESAQADALAERDEARQDADRARAALRRAQGQVDTVLERLDEASRRADEADEAVRTAQSAERSAEREHARLTASADA